MRPRAAAGHLYAAGIYGGLKNPTTVLRFPLQNGLPAQTPDLTYPNVYGPVGLDPSNQLYAIDATGTTVVVFAPNSTTVRRTLTVMQHLAFVPITGLTLDPAGYLYLALQDLGLPGIPPTACGWLVSEYAPGAQGNANPVHCLTSPVSSYWPVSPYALAVNQNGRLFMPSSAIDEDAVYVFGNVRTSPYIERTQYGPSLKTTMGTALDEASELFVLSGAFSNGHYDSSVSVYPADTNGLVTPLRTIAPYKPTGWIGGIAVNGGLLYVATGTWVLVYDASSNGRVHALGGVHVAGYSIQSLALGP